MTNAAATRKLRPASPERAQAPVDREGGREIELKLRLRAQDVATLRARLNRLGRARREHIDSVYYDTPDQRLAAAKAALRLRAVGQGRGRRWVQNVKTQDSVEALSMRGEWERPAPRGRIDTASLADSPLAPILGSHSAGGAKASARPFANLRPVFRTVFDRTAWDLVLDDAHIEAVIDLGEIRAGDYSEPICEAELELLAGSPGALLDLALQLAGVAGRKHADLSLVPYGVSKAARGYRLASGAGPAPLAASFSTAYRAFTPAQRVGAAGRRLVAIGMSVVLTNAAHFALDGDCEFVHQARVAIRRMRAGLDLLGAAAEPPPVVMRGLRMWAGRFGRVRDWDVLCGDHLPPLAAAAAPRVAGTWQNVCAVAVKRRDRARALLYRQLQTPAFAEFALRSLHWSASVPTKPGKRLAAFARKAVRARLRRLAVAGRTFSKLPKERQHKVRIQAKGLRYGIEMLQASLPKKLRAGISALARFQDAAGSAQDALIVQAAVHGLTRSPPLRRQVDEWAQAQRAAAIVKAHRLAANLKALH